MFAYMAQRGPGRMLLISKYQEVELPVIDNYLFITLYNIETNS